MARYATFGGVAAGKLQAALYYARLARKERASGIPSATVAPVISGTPTEGQQLSVSTGSWDNSPVAYLYQWRKNGSPISGATADTYNLTLTDGGSLVDCVVTAINGYGSREKVSAAVGPVVELWTPSDLFGPSDNGAWYDFSDLSTMFQNTNGTVAVTTDGNPVGYVADKSGKGHPLIAPNNTARPLYKTSGGLHWLEGDGVNHRMATASFAMSVPVDVVGGFASISWVQFDRLVGEIGPNFSILQNGAASPAYGLAGGAGIISFAGPALGTTAIFVARSNGASSRVGINNGAYVTGNGGTNNVNGVKLFDYSVNATPSRPVNGRCYGLLVINRALTDPEIAQLKTWLAAKSGVVL